jgi:phage gpG-like protein
MITINVIGIESLSKGYSAFRAELSDMKEPMMEVTDYYVNEVEKNFANEGKTFGQPWLPSSPQTIKAKEGLMKKGLAISTKTLVLTGKMRDGFGAFVKAKYGQLFNSQSYVQVHNEGGVSTIKTRQGNKTIQIPQRVLADVDETREKKVASIFEVWVGKIIKNNSI